MKIYDRMLQQGQQQEGVWCIYIYACIYIRTYHRHHTTFTESFSHAAHFIHSEFS